jgi:hypothetical protein
MSGSVNAPFGLRPVEHWNGNPWNGATRILVTEDGNDALYIGDPLYRVVADGKEITGRYMCVDQLTGAGVVDGVDDQIVGVMMSRAGQSFAAGAGGVGELLQSDLVYIPADTDAALLNACVDQSVVFSGSTSTGLSGFVLDGSAAAANNAHHVVIIGLWDDPVNLVGDQYSLWLVYLNIPWLAVGGYSSVTGTLGV